MRESKRQRVIEAALAIIHDEGAPALTFEAVAARTGLTRGGIIYHFRNRADLLEGIAQEIGRRWHEEALGYLEGVFDDATPGERISALVRSVIEAPLGPAEMGLFAAGGAERAALARVSAELDRRWAGDPASLTPEQRIALLAAEGLWLRRLMNGGAGYPDDEDLVGRIQAMASGSDHPGVRRGDAGGRADGQR